MFILIYYTCLAVAAHLANSELIPLIAGDEGDVFIFLQDDGSYKYTTNISEAAERQKTAEALDENLVFLRNPLTGNAYEMKDILPKHCEYNQVYCNGVCPRNCNANKTITAIWVSRNQSENRTRGMVRGLHANVTLAEVVSGTVHNTGYVIGSTVAVSQVTLKPGCILCNDSVCQGFTENREVFTLYQGKHYTASCGPGEVALLYCRQGDCPRHFNQGGSRIIELPTGGVIENYFPDAESTRATKDIAYFYGDHITNDNIVFNHGRNPLADLFGSSTFNRKRRSAGGDGSDEDQPEGCNMGERVHKVCTYDHQAKAEVCEHRRCRMGEEVKNSTRHRGKRSLSTVDIQTSYNLYPVATFVSEWITFGQITSLFSDVGSAFSTVTSTINNNNGRIEKGFKDVNADVADLYMEVAYTRTWVGNIANTLNKNTRKLSILESKAYYFTQALVSSRKTDFILLNEIKRNRNLDTVDRTKDLEKQCNGTLHGVKHDEKFSIAYCLNGTFFRVSQNFTAPDYDSDSTKFAAIFNGEYILFDGFQAIEKLYNPSIRFTSSFILMLKEKRLTKDTINLLSKMTRDQLISNCDSSGYKCVYVPGMNYSVDNTYSREEKLYQTMENMKEMGMIISDPVYRDNKWHFDCEEPIEESTQGENFTLTFPGERLCNTSSDVEGLFRKSLRARDRKVKLVYLKEVGQKEFPFFSFVEDVAESFVESVEDAVDALGSFDGPWAFGNIMSIALAIGLVVLSVMTFLCFCKCLKTPGLET